MGFNEQRKEIIDICDNLLKEKKVELILGFTSGESEEATIPLFIRDRNQLEGLKWDGTCTSNLAKYTPEKQEKTAVIAKACDARALVMYMTEKQIEREKVYIIGVECPGMKLANGSEAPGCGDCTVRVPPVYDVLVKAEENSVTDEPSNTETLKDGEEQEDEKTKEDMIKTKIDNNLARFQNEMKKCILCFSCRQICYGCYCKTCFMERNIPNWMPAEMDMGQKMTFHLGRAMHLAGRCVECGACERACPSGVKLRYLIKELTELCQEEYGYKAGIDPDEAPAMAAFDQSDREIGFLGGDNDDETCC